MRWRAALVMLAGCSFRVSGSGAPDDARADDAQADDARRNDAMRDAASDAGFDAASCPASYVVIGSSPTRYRPLVTSDTYWRHEATCEADSAGLTHAAVLDSLGEASDLRTYLLATSPAVRTYGVGVVQSPTATQVAEGWVDFRDRAVDPALWGTYAAVQQPEDGAVGGLASPEDHQQNVAFLDLDATGTNPYLRDGNGNGAYVFVCECDGLGVGALAQSYVLADPNRVPP